MLNHSPQVERERQTDMKEPRVISCNFVNTPKTVLLLLTEVKMFLIMSHKNTTSLAGHAI